MPGEPRGWESMQVDLNYSSYPLSEFHTGFLEAIRSNTFIHKQQPKHPPLKRGYLSDFEFLRSPLEMNADMPLFPRRHKTIRPKMNTVITIESVLCVATSASHV